MKGIRVGIAGSYREFDKRYQFSRSKEEFYKTCQLIGSLLAQQERVSELVIGISNDHLEEQMGRVWLTENGEPTMKYKMEDTGDYHALIGFLSELSPDSKSKVTLLASQKTMEGGSTEHLEIKLNPFMEREFEHLSTGNKHTFDEFESRMEVTNISPNNLRSVILQESLVPKVDLLILVGGGKATDKAYDQAVLRNKFILPLPYFNGMSLKYLAEGLNSARHIFQKRLAEIVPEKLDVGTTQFLAGMNTGSFQNSAINVPVFDELTPNQVTESLKLIVKSTFESENQHIPHLLSNESLTKIRGAIEFERKQLKEFFKLINKRFNFDNKGTNVTNPEDWPNYLLMPILGIDDQIDTESLRWFFGKILPKQGFNGFRLITDKEVELFDTDEAVSFYDYSQEKWQFSDVFLSNLFLHLKCSEGDYTRLLKAIGMLMIHEALHVDVHNIGSGLHRGIGDFYHVIEDSDYQADVWAFLIRTAFDAQNARIEKNDYFKYMLDTLDVAMQTTKAFITSGQEIFSVEIRRFNRIVFLAWQYARIKDPSEQDGKFDTIVNILTNKPSLEFRGVKQFSTEDDTRIEFSLEEKLLQIAEHNKVIQLAIFSNNRVMRLGGGNDHHNLVDVFRAFRSVNIDLVKEVLLKVYQERRTS